MPTEIGRMIAKVRRQRKLTQARLAEGTGYTAVMIAKIESGDRKPSVDRLPDFARALNVPLRELQQALVAPESSGGPSAVVRATRLGKANAERGKVLRNRSEDLKKRTDEAAARYEISVRQSVDEIIEPFVAAALSIVDAPDDLLVPVEPLPSEGHGLNPQLLAEAQQATAGYMRHLLFTGAASLGAGAVSGAMAGAGTFAAVASMATASTGAAIATLHGVAATSATLAWLGGGALTAGGAGIAGGTLALTGIVAAPLLLVAAGVLASQGRRMLDLQEKAKRQLDRAEADLDHNTVVMEKFNRRTGEIVHALEFAAARVEALLPDIQTAFGEDKGQHAFGDLSNEVAGAFRTCGRLVTTMLTLLSLPVSLQQETAGIARDAAAEGLERVSTRLEQRAPKEEEFIDFVIETSKKQIARA